MKVYWIVAITGIILVTMVAATSSIAPSGMHVPGSLQAPETMWVVDSTADSGTGTLREALQDAVAGDTIVFDPAVFPPGSPSTISVTSGPLPPITQGSLTIDASDAGVIVSGGALPYGHGLEIQSDGNLVEGFQIVNFPYHGILVAAGASDNIIGGDTAAMRNVLAGNGLNGVSIEGAGADYTVVIGNYIGVDASGQAAWPNNSQGVALWDGARHNQIGGLTAEQRNVISGNAANGILLQTGVMSNTISGNYIGMDASGTQPLGNGQHGILLTAGGSYNVIGGDTAGERNVICGNGIDGVNIYGTGTDHNTIVGNYIGLDAAGTASLGNTYEGVTIENGGRYNVVGGTTPGERNVISGNGSNGILMHTDVMSNTISGNYIGTDASGSQPLGNGHSGIQMWGSASHNTIGGDSAAERNIITYNGGNGVSIQGDNSVDNAIQNNWIGIDADSTGGLDPGALAVAADVGAAVPLPSSPPSCCR